MISYKKYLRFTEELGIQGVLAQRSFSQRPRECGNKEDEEAKRREELVRYIKDMASTAHKNRRNQSNN